MSMFIDATSRAKFTHIAKQFLIITLLGFDMLHDAFFYFGIFLKSKGVIILTLYVDFVQSDGSYKGRLHSTLPKLFLRHQTDDMQ